MIADILKLIGYLRGAQPNGSRPNQSTTRESPSNAADHVPLLPEEYESAQSREELVIGLIGAIGTDFDLAFSKVQSLLHDYEYDCDVVRVSDQIKRMPKYASLDRKRPREYFNGMIEGGNYICATWRQKGALADLAILEISRLRCRIAGKRRAFVIISLKRPQEVECLRQVYGDRFYAIGLFSDELVREQALMRQHNDPTGEPNALEGLQQAKQLIIADRDQDTEWGQKVGETFPLSDYFVRVDAGDLGAAIRRFFCLVFGAPYESPTKGEVAMMHAYTASLRSVDLSRQVGAAIVARDGRILTTGCNEVPSPGGGQYWADQGVDGRDFNKGYDINIVKRREAAVEFLNKIEPIIERASKLDGMDKLYEELLNQGAFAGSRVNELIEFGRALHAEMAALNNALLQPLSTRDSDLYCTTFPCHMCTRLLIGAGIRNVFYIEPYAKSASLEMYGDTEIVVNPRLQPGEYRERLEAGAVCDRKLHMIPFEGVAPRRYIDMFAKKKRRKPNGSVVDFDSQAKKPRRTKDHVATHRITETWIADRAAPRAEALRTGSADAHEQPRAPSEDHGRP